MWDSRSLIDSEEISILRYEKWMISLDIKDLKASDRRLASVPKTIEVVKILFPQGLFLTSIIQIFYSIGCIKVIMVCY